MNILAHSIQKDLAGTSCTLQITSDVTCGVSVVDMSLSAALDKDLPHFFLLHEIAQPYEMTYLGPNEYEGFVECDTYVVTTPHDFENALDEIEARAKPRIILLDIDHLKLDRNMAVAAVTDFIEDGDMWEEQVIVCVHKNYEEPEEQPSDECVGRTGHTAEVHVLVKEVF